MSVQHRRCSHKALVAVSAVASRRDLGGFSGIIGIIDDFLFDESHWTIESACLRGLPRLVRRLMETGAPVRSDASYIGYLCNKGITIAAALGDIETTKAYVTLFPTLVITHAVNSAAGEGRVDVLDWLLQRRPLVVWSAGAFARATLCDRVDVLQWFMTHNFDVAEEPMLLDTVIAAQKDNIFKLLWPHFERRKEYAVFILELIVFVPVRLARWMVSNSTTDIVISLDKPAARGDIEFLRWAQGYKSTIATTKAMDGAAAEGHLDVVIWLHSVRDEGCTTAAIDKAATHGHFEIVKWLTNYRHEGCTGRALFGAAMNGRLDIFCWLADKWPCFVCPAATFDHVCAMGHLEVARYLTKNGNGGGSTKAMDWAAANNHVEMLGFLEASRTEGCTIGAMNSAAANGSMVALEWLSVHRDEGCTSAAMDLAVHNGHDKIVKWLWGHRQEGCSSRAIRFAAQRRDLVMMKWLSEHYPVESSVRAIDQAVDGGSLECVQWCHEHRCEYTSTEGTFFAVRRGSFPILEYLRQVGSQSCGSDSFPSALKCRHLYISAWIARNFPHVTDRGLLFSAGRTNGWNAEMLKAVFEKDLLEEATVMYD